MEIPFFRYPSVFGEHREELHQAFLRVADSGAFILQQDVADFETALAEYCGVRHAIGVGNATDALELVMAAAGIGPGDEVILPSHTFVASASAVVRSGATPVFAEIGADHLMDPDDLARRLTPRTRAVMPTQLNGRTARMSEIQDFVDEHGLILLEDSAQGIGSTLNGRMSGTFAVAGVYSFYPAKTLGSLGDAGAVVTDDDQVAERIRLIRDHGRGGHGGLPQLWGRNTRMDNLQAAFLGVKLRHLPASIERRREVARIYHDGLGGIDGLVLPPFDGGGHFDAFQNYEIEADDRDGLRDHLSRNGVGSILQWGGLGVHQFEKLGDFGSLPETERILARSFLLPMNTTLTDDEAAYVVRTIREYFGES